MHITYMTQLQTCLLNKELKVDEEYRGKINTYMYLRVMFGFLLLSCAEITYNFFLLI